MTARGPSRRGPRAVPRPRPDPAGPRSRPQPAGVMGSWPRPVTAAPNRSRHSRARALTSRRVASATPESRFSRTGSTATRSATVTRPYGSRADRARAERPARVSGVDGSAVAARSSASSGMVRETGSNTDRQAASIWAAVSYRCRALRASAVRKNATSWSPTARSNMRASIVASSWTDAGSDSPSPNFGVAPVAISNRTTAAEYRSAAESYRPRAGSSRNGSRYGGVPAVTAVAPARDREKSNSTRCLARSLRPSRTPRLAGLMSRWSTPARSSATRASSRSVPQRSSRSSDRRSRPRSTSPSVSSPAVSRTRACRPPTSIGTLNEPDQPRVVQAGEHLGLVGQPAGGRVVDRDLEDPGGVRPGLSRWSGR